MVIQESSLKLTFVSVKDLGIFGSLLRIVVQMQIHPSFFVYLIAFVGSFVMCSHSGFGITSSLTIVVVELRAHNKSTNITC